MVALWIPENYDKDPKEAVIASIHVIGKFRRRGLAKMVLLAAVDDGARKNGYPIMTLGVDAKNVGAGKSYEEVGFVYTRKDDVYSVL